MTEDQKIKTFEVPVRIVFTGTVKVHAPNSANIRSNIQKDFWATIGNLGANGYDHVFDWDIGTHCERIEVNTNEIRKVDDQ
jgi:hypothetical protein